MNLRAVEFFSGIGAFSQATKSLPVDIVAAFDQNANANRVYESNFKLCPRNNNLDSISSNSVPEASLWWLSPPCAPYSRRGRGRDLDDPRATSLKRLIELIPEHRPERLFVENVEAFGQSDACRALTCVLADLGYRVKPVSLCSTQLGVPMRRPRLFVVAVRGGNINLDLAGTGLDRFCDQRGLSDYLTEDGDDSLLVEPSKLERYENVLNIVDPRDRDASLICFTSGYYRCSKAAGSLIRRPDGRVRYVSPREIVDLLGFDQDFRFSETVSAKTGWRLAGNSVDVRCIRLLMAMAGVR